MADTYAQAYAEVLVIIGFMDEQSRNKIPKKLIDFFKDNKDSNFQFNFEGNEFSQKAIDLLAMLEIKYLATDSEKEVLKNALVKNDIKLEAELREKYNPDDLFKSRAKK